MSWSVRASDGADVPSVESAPLSIGRPDNNSFHCSCRANRQRQRSPAMISLFAMIQSLTWNGKILLGAPRFKFEGQPWSSGRPYVSHTQLAEYLNVGLGFSLALYLGGMGNRRSGTIAVRALAAWMVGVLVLGITTAQSRGVFGDGGHHYSHLSVFAHATGLAVGWAAGTLATAAVFLLALGDASPYGTTAELDSQLGGRRSRFRTEIWRESSRGWSTVVGQGIGDVRSLRTPILRA